MDGRESCCCCGDRAMQRKRRAMYSSRTRRRSTFSLFLETVARKAPAGRPPRSLLSSQPLERGTCAALIAAKLITLSAILPTAAGTV